MYQTPYKTRMASDTHPRMNFEGYYCLENEGGTPKHAQAKAKAEAKRDTCYGKVRRFFSLTGGALHHPETCTHL